jgi:hypothetical protein
MAYDKFLSTSTTPHCHCGTNTSRMETSKDYLYGIFPICQVKRDDLKKLQAQHMIINHDVDWKETLNPPKSLHITEECDRFSRTRKNVVETTSKSHRSTLSKLRNMSGRIRLLVGFELRSSGRSYYDFKTLSYFQTLLKFLRIWLRLPQNLHQLNLAEGTEIVVSFLFSGFLIL